MQVNTCPRVLCNDCHRSFRWKVSCRSCKAPICKEHDFRALKFRKCGFRDMHTEREYARTYQQEVSPLVIPEFKASKSGSKATEPSVSVPSESSTESAGVTTMSQSQILVPSSAVATPFDTQHPAGGSAANHDGLPSAAASPHRPRSFSASSVRNRNALFWSNPTRGEVNSITNPLPIPCSPRHPVQWEGCGAYFCQSARLGGDHRPSCPGVLKVCKECEVLVCEVSSYHALFCCLLCPGH